jgi:hypothetical protein
MEYKPQVSTYIAVKESLKVYFKDINSCDKLILPLYPLLVVTHRRFNFYTHYCSSLYYLPSL